MTTPALGPLRFEPILKRLIWGGRRLGALLEKPLGDGEDYAESWEVSDHGGDVSRVADGPFQGTTLHELVRNRGRELLGPRLADRSQFPLLVKFLDAHQVLSVQVHPDDALARALTDDNGKTETWIIIHADPGSVIYAGLKAGVDRARFAAALASKGGVEPLLHRFEPKAGDSVLIPAGTVHAVGAGIVLAEIQQMSDTTFRVYDWGRVGPDGKPRALHIEQALRAIDFERGPVDPIVPEVESIEGGTRERLATCPYFEIERWSLDGPARLGSFDRFTIVMGIAGRSDVEHGGRSVPLRLGQTLLLPAAAGPCVVTPRDAKATVLTCIVP